MTHRELRRVLALQMSVRWRITTRTEGTGEVLSTGPGAQGAPADAGTCVPYLRSRFSFRRLHKTTLNTLPDSSGG